MILRVAGAALASCVIGCGGDAKPLIAAVPVPSARARTSPLVADGGSETSPSTTLDILALAARGPWLAPGMREIARLEANEKRVRREIVRAPERDVCVRVAFTADVAVHAWLEDGRGARLADGGQAASGALGTRGPVCVRRGDAIVVRVDADVPTPIRIVAWSAP